MSAWKDFVTAALIGTERCAPPPLPSSLDSALGSMEGLGREEQFLTRAGALALWRRAGWKPLPAESAIEPAGPDEAPLISSASAAHLRAMLSDRCTAVLPEWLAEAVCVRRRVPPELLPALLERARRERSLRPLALAAGGKRAVWLASHNSAWAFAAPSDSPELWETGGHDQRVEIFRAIRRRAPAEARAKLEAVWASEPAESRTTFLAELEHGLSTEDEPFLETALTDRSKEVRRGAVDLLARLPESAFAARMIARAAPLLVFKAGGFLSRATLEVTLPAEPDPAGIRDGLEPKAFGNQKKLGDKAVLLTLILAAVPLRHWTDELKQTPAAIVKLAEKSEFAAALATGWTWAALRQRDAAWAAALLDGPLKAHDEFLPRISRLSILPVAEQTAYLTGLVNRGALDTLSSDAWVACVAHLGSIDGHWPAPLARAVLRALRGAVAKGAHWGIRTQIESLLLHVPPELLPEAIEGWPADQEGVSTLIELLTFRQEALKELSGA